MAAAGERVVGMVTLCVLHTLTGPKAYLDHLVVAPDRRRREIGFLERDTRSFRLRLDHGGGHGGAGVRPRDATK